MRPGDGAEIEFIHMHDLDLKPCDGSSTVCGPNASCMAEPPSASRMTIPVAGSKSTTRRINFVMPVSRNVPGFFSCQDRMGVPATTWHARVAKHIGTDGLT
jgi:hypothetical protein